MREPYGVGGGKKGGRREVEKGEGRVVGEERGERSNGKWITVEQCM